MVQPPSRRFFFLHHRLPPLFFLFDPLDPLSLGLGKGEGSMAGPQHRRGTVHRGPNFRPCPEAVDRTLKALQRALGCLDARRKKRSLFLSLQPWFQHGCFYVPFSHDLPALYLAFRLDRVHGRVVTHLFGAPLSFGCSVGLRPGDTGGFRRLVGRGKNQSEIRKWFKGWVFIRILSWKGKSGGKNHSPKKERP